MKIKLLLGLLLISVSLIKAQDSTSKVSLKTYWNTELVSDYGSTVSNSFLSFAVALKSLENNFHEIELISLSINNNSTDYYSSSSFYLKLNYEYNVRFFKKSKKMNYFLGLGASPYLSSARTSFSSNYGFDDATSSRGVEMNLVPRIQFRLNKKLGFEIKAPLEILALDSYTIVDDNPAVPQDMKKYSISSFSNLLDDNARSHIRLSFGISYKL